MNDFEKTVLQYIAKAEPRMDRIENDLKEHKEGVIQNRTRIESLEAPRVALGQIKKWSMWLVAVGGAIAIIYKVVG